MRAYIAGERRNKFWTMGDNGHVARISQIWQGGFKKYQRAIELVLSADEGGSVISPAEPPFSNSLVTATAVPQNDPDGGARYRFIRWDRWSTDVIGDNGEVLVPGALLVSGFSAINPYTWYITDDWMEPNNELRAYFQEFVELFKEVSGSGTAVFEGFAPNTPSIYVDVGQNTGNLIASVVNPPYQTHRFVEWQRVTKNPDGSVAGTESLSTDNTYGFVMSSDWRNPSNTIRAAFSEFINLFAGFTGNGRGTLTWSVRNPSSGVWEQVDTLSPNAYSSETITASPDVGVRVRLTATAQAVESQLHRFDSFEKVNTETNLATPLTPTAPGVYEFDVTTSWRLPENRINAKFTEIVNLLLEAVSSPGGAVGTIDGNGGAIDVDAPARTFTAVLPSVENQFYRFVRWERARSDGDPETTPLSSNNVYSFSMTQAWRPPNNILRAVFTEYFNLVPYTGFSGGDANDSGMSLSNYAPSYGGATTAIANVVNPQGQTWRFVAWDRMNTVNNTVQATGVSADNPYALEINDLAWRWPNNGIRARFSEYVYITRSGSGGTGSGSETGGNTGYDVGTIVNFHAEPDISSTFTRWEIWDAENNTWETHTESDSFSITVTTEHRTSQNTFRAVYAIKTFIVTINRGTFTNGSFTGGGTVGFTPSTGYLTTSAEVNYGDSVNIYADYSATATVTSWGARTGIIRNWTGYETIYAQNFTASNITQNRTYNANYSC